MPLECVIGNQGTLNPCPGNSIHLQHTTGLDTFRDELLSVSQTYPAFSFWKITIVNTGKCREPKIRHPHRNFTEALRHPEPASNLEGYGARGGTGASYALSKNKEMQFNKCVCVCVCQRHTRAERGAGHTT